MIFSTKNLRVRVIFTKLVKMIRNYVYKHLNYLYKHCMQEILIVATLINYSLKVTYDVIATSQR